MIEDWIAAILITATMGVSLGFTAVVTFVWYGKRMGLFE